MDFCHGRHKISHPILGTDFLHHLVLVDIHNQRLQDPLSQEVCGKPSKHPTLGPGLVALPCAARFMVILRGTLHGHPRASAAIIDWLCRQTRLPTHSHDRHTSLRIPTLHVLPDSRVSCQETRGSAWTSQASNSAQLLPGTSHSRCHSQPRWCNDFLKKS